MLPFLQATQSLGKFLSSPEIPFFDSSVIILLGKNSQRTPFTSIRICMKLRNKSIPLFSSPQCSSIFAVFSLTLGPGPPKILRFCVRQVDCARHIPSELEDRPLMIRWYLGSYMGSTETVPEVMVGEWSPNMILRCSKMF